MNRSNRVLQLECARAPWRLSTYSGERDARPARVVLLSSELSARAPIALIYNGLLKSGFMQPVDTFAFAKDTGQFKGILKAIIHDVDELVYDEDAGGDVPLQFTIQKDFSKNDNRPIRVCDKEEELDLPPY